MRLFLAMLIITIMEVILISKVGSVIGFLNTFLLIIATAILGSWQLRKQWHFVMSKLQTLQGEPSQALTEALILLICGILLITPGFLTDIIGFLGLVPSIRGRFAGFMRHHAGSFIRSGSHFTVYSQTRSTHYQNRSRQKDYSNDHIIDGEFERKDDSPNH